MSKTTHSAAKRILLAGLPVTAALLLQSAAVAQSNSQPDEQTLSGIGGGTEYVQPAGGLPVSNVGGTPLFRAPSPNAQDLNASVIHEAWSGQGKRVLKGTRDTLLLSYSRGLCNDSEINAVLPIERNSGPNVPDPTDPFLRKVESSGYGDLELNYRKYIYDHKRQDSVTWVPGIKLFLPTDNDKGVSPGEFGIGPSITVSKPLGKNTLLYAGASYVLLDGTVFIQIGPGLGAKEVSNKDIFQQWVGGTTNVNKKWAVQYDLTHFNSVTDEKFLKALGGVRYGLTPTRAIQLNVQKELKADGKSTAVSLGYSSRF